MFDSCFFYMDEGSVSFEGIKVKKREDNIYLVHLSAEIEGMKKLYIDTHIDTPDSQMH